MSYSVNNEEISSVLKLDARARYDYFIKRVADWEEMWSLRNSAGWETLADNEGRTMLALWPHERFAQLCATGLWSASIPSRIDLTELLDGWVPELLHAGRSIAVFPLPSGRGIPVDPQRLKDDLLAECSKLED